MPATVEITEKEIRKLKGIFRGFDLKLSGKVKKSMALAGLHMETVAKINTPVDTGRLRASEHYRSADKGYAAEAYTNVEYAQYVNDGTTRQHGRFFMEKGQAAGVKMFLKLMKR